MGYWDEEQQIYKVNPELEKEIFSKIPAGYSKLEEALFIYNELCKTLRYSLDFYINENIYVHKFTNPDYLEDVDGKDNKDVVCFTYYSFL